MSYNTRLQTNNSSLEEILNTINDLPEANNGTDTSDATATENDILSGKTAYANGEKLIGTIATKTASNLIASGATVTVPAGYYASQATKSVSTATQATPSISVNSSGLITASVTQTAGYVVTSTKSATKQLAFQAAKTITPGTTNQIAVSSGYYTGGNIIVKGDSNLLASNIKSGTSIFGVVGTLSAGIDTTDATATSSDILVGKTAYANGVKLTGVYAAPTGTIPIISNGTYDVTGYASAIVDVSSGSTADTAQEDGMVVGTLSYYVNDRVTSIRNYAFQYCSKLTTVSFPACINIGQSAFYWCSKLTTVSFPACISIWDYAFQSCSSLTTASFPVCTQVSSYAFFYCTKLTTVSFPACTRIWNYAFARCSSLTTASFPACTQVSNYAFHYCSKLTTVSFPVCSYVGNYAFAFCSNLTNLTIGASSVAKLNNINAFSSTPMSISTLTGAFGSIYVPASLVDAYKSATNWATYSNRITAIVE